MIVPHQTTKLKYFFYKRLISLCLLFSMFLPPPRLSVCLFIYLLNCVNEHSLSFLFHPDFPAAACIFSFLSFFVTPSSHLYILSSSRSFFSADRCGWPHHSAAHKGGLRVPVSSTYDPNSAPYFFERLEKHAVTAVHVIACAQGASRLSVRRDRHVGHSWWPVRSELGVQSMNKVSGLINICSFRKKLLLLSGQI